MAWDTVGAISLCASALLLWTLVCFEDFSPHKFVHRGWVLMAMGTTTYLTPIAGAEYFYSVLVLAGIALSLVGVGLALKKEPGEIEGAQGRRRLPDLH
jgi:hypothetical protein